MGVYRLEVASTNRAGCNGKKPCKGTKILKGELKLGTWVPFKDSGSYKWRHWGCVTPEQFKNLHVDFEKAEDLDGYEELPEPYQEKVSAAFKDGHVAEEDIPDTARYPAESNEEGEEDGEPTPKKPKKSKAKAKKEEADDEDDDVEEKPKKKKKATKKAKAEPEEEDDEDEEVMPKPKARKKPTSKKLVDDEDLDEEDEKPAKKPKKRASKAMEIYEDDEDVKPAKATSSKKAKSKPAKDENDENKVPRGKRERA